MYKLDYHDYEGLSVAEAEDKANKEFDKYLEHKTDKKSLELRARKVLLASIVLIFMVFASVMPIVFEIKNSPSAGDLGLDATNGVYVADKANVLNDKVKQQVYDLNKKLEKSDYHAQIMVVVVNKISDQYGGNINDYSMAIAEKYKPGDKKQNTGLLYTVAIKDHKARLEVGYGLEGKIPDATAAKLQQPANAHYKNGEYSAGVAALLDGVQQVLLDGKPIDKIAVAPSYETDKNSTALHILLYPILLIGYLALGLVFACPLVVPAVMIFYFSSVKELVQDIKEYHSRIKEPSKWITRDREDRKQAITTAIDMSLHPDSYFDSSVPSFSGGSSFSSSSSSGSNGRSSSGNSSSGGGSFGGGGATTSW